MALVSATASGIGTATRRNSEHLLASGDVNDIHKAFLVHKAGNAFRKSKGNFRLTPPVYQIKGVYFSVQYGMILITNPSERLESTVQKPPNL